MRMKLERGLALRKFVLLSSYLIMVGTFPPFWQLYSMFGQHAKVEFCTITTRLQLACCLFSTTWQLKHSITSFYGGADFCHKMLLEQNKKKLENVSTSDKRQYFQVNWLQ